MGNIIARMRFVLSDVFNLNKPSSEHSWRKQKRFFINLILDYFIIHSQHFPCGSFTFTSQALICMRVCVCVCVYGLLVFFYRKEGRICSVSSTRFQWYFPFLFIQSLRSSLGLLVFKHIKVLFYWHTIESPHKINRKR